MKPIVFLSHSKSDRQFVEKLATDLAFAGLAVWYDDWEIPPGESFRRKIFDDGISNCDLFFVYITQQSVESYWVQRELDAAFVREAESKGGFIGIFVESDSIRKKMSLDLQALNSPVFNKDEYSRPLTKLISRAWDVSLKRKLSEVSLTSQLEILKLQKTLAELEAQLLRTKISGSSDIDGIMNSLEKEKFDINQKSVSLADIFRQFAFQIATGVNLYWFRKTLAEFYKVEESDSIAFLTADIMGKLAVYGLVFVKPPAGEWGESYYLTALGISVGKIISK